MPKAKLEMGTPQKKETAKEIEKRLEKEDKSIARAGVWKKSNPM